MSKESYEILLLEVRQSLKDAEEELRSLGCINMAVFRRIKKLKRVIKLELIQHRMGKDKNKDLENLIEG